jgi:copper homeostasis protein
MLESLELMIGLGFDRVLTSGTPWGSGRTAVDGIGVLSQLIHRAAGRIEIVIGGGVTPENARTIVAGIPLVYGNISVHAYSGVQERGITKLERVKSLCEAVRPLPGRAPSA